MAFGGNDGASQKNRLFIKEGVIIINPINLKPGVQTSEFLGVLIAQAIGVLVLTKVIPAEQAGTATDYLTQLFNAGLQLVTAIITFYYMIRPILTYIESRTALKTALIQQRTNPNINYSVTAGGVMGTLPSQVPPSGGTGGNTAGSI